MATCTFFGHKDTPTTVEPLLRSVLLDFINKRQVSSFYVGNNGNFDCMVKNTLQGLQQAYPHIQYAVIPAYPPTETKRKDQTDPSPIFFPPILENTPPRAAIPQRNRWMLERSDYVITYITHAWGNAAQYQRLAEKKRKIALNLANEDVQSHVAHHTLDFVL